MRRWLVKFWYLFGLAVFWIVSLFAERLADAYELVPQDKQGFEKLRATIETFAVLPFHIPAYVFVISLLTIVALLYSLRSRGKKREAQPTEPVTAPEARIPLTPHDERLFQDFRALFADRGYMALYRDHHFLSPFPREAWLPLMRVADTWVDAAHTFSHPQLEAKALQFRQAAGALATAIATYTTPTDSQTHITTLNRRVDPENPPQWIRDEVEQIHSLIPAFVDTHEELLKLGNSLGAKLA